MPGNSSDYLMTIAQIFVFFGIIINIGSYSYAGIDNILWMFPRNPDDDDYDRIANKHKFVIFAYLSFMSFICLIFDFEITPIVDICMSFLTPIFMIIIPGWLIRIVKFEDEQKASTWRRKSVYQDFYGCLYGDYDDCFLFEFESLVRNSYSLNQNWLFLKIGTFYFFKKNQIHEKNKRKSVFLMIF